MFNKIGRPYEVYCWNNMLSSEFNLYLERPALIFYDCVYAVVGIILFIFISSGVRREMKNLADLAELQDEFADNGSEVM